jgi:hypothetical protein
MGSYPPPFACSIDGIFLWGFLWVCLVKVPTISVSIGSSKERLANPWKATSVAACDPMVATSNSARFLLPALLLTEGL